MMLVILEALTVGPIGKASFFNLWDEGLRFPTSTVP